MNENEFQSKSVDQFKDLEDRLKEIKDRTTELVQKHPIAAITIAVGVGYIIAKLLTSRRS